MDCEYVTYAHNSTTGCWEAIEREPWDGVPLDQTDLSAADLGCEPGSLFLVKLVDCTEERVLATVEVMAR